MCYIDVSCKLINAIQTREVIQDSHIHTYVL